MASSLGVGIHFRLCSGSISMAMKNAALLRTGRSIADRHHITRRRFVTENLQKIEDENICNVIPNNGAKISVWWNVQRCKVPADSDAGKVVSNIRDGLRWIHCFGPVDFWAYGDMENLSSQTVTELHNSGVRLRHIPRDIGLLNHFMIADMIAWTKRNPPPAIHMLILHYDLPDFFPVRRLVGEIRDEGFHVLLAQEQQLTCTLLAAANAAWSWKTFQGGIKE